MKLIFKDSSTSNNLPYVQVSGISTDYWPMGIYYSDSAGTFEIAGNVISDHTWNITYNLEGYKTGTTTYHVSGSTKTIYMTRNTATAIPTVSNINTYLGDYWSAKKSGTLTSYQCAKMSSLNSAYSGLLSFPSYSANQVPPFWLIGRKHNPAVYISNNITTEHSISSGATTVNIPISGSGYVWGIDHIYIEDDGSLPYTFKCVVSANTGTSRNITGKINLTGEYNTAAMTSAIESSITITIHQAGQQLPHNFTSDSFGEGGSDYGSIYMAGENYGYYDFIDNSNNDYDVRYTIDSKSSNWDSYMTFWIDYGGPVGEGGVIMNAGDYSEICYNCGSYHSASEGDYWIKIKLYSTNSAPIYITFDITIEYAYQS